MGHARGAVRAAAAAGLHRHGHDGRLVQGRGHLVVVHVAREQHAGPLVPHELLAQGTARVHADGVLKLAQGRRGADDLAEVVGAHIVENLDQARLGVHRDLAEVHVHRADDVGLEGNAGLSAKAHGQLADAHHGDLGGRVGLEADHGVDDVALLGRGAQKSGPRGQDLLAQLVGGLLGGPGARGAAVGGVALLPVVVVGRVVHDDVLELHADLLGDDELHGVGPIRADERLGVGHIDLAVDAHAQVDVVADHAPGLRGGVAHGHAVHAPVLQRALPGQVPLLVPAESLLARVHASRERGVGHGDVPHDDVARVHAQRVGNLGEGQVHRLIARLAGVGRGAGAVRDVIAHLGVDVGARRLLEALRVGRQHQVTVRLVAVTAARARLVDVL